MAEAYPYVLVNGKIQALLDALSNAARPPRFSYEFLKSIGFGSSNDRAFVSLFRRLGFINENGVPTPAYDELRDRSKRAHALGESIKQGYADLFAINTTINTAPDDEIKAAISRVTGKDAENVSRVFNTLRALLALAKFDGMPRKADKLAPAPEPVPAPETKSETLLVQNAVPAMPSLHYNIQIHLPATTDISVYNAIFKSMRDTLGVV